MKISSTFFFIHAIILALILTMSCQPSREKTIAKSTGKTAEILVVMEDKLWETMPGEVMREVFYREEEGLPQAENSYDLIRIAPRFLDDVYQKHHNIIVVSINTANAEARVETRDDYWATPQRLIRILAPDEASFEKVFRERQNSILDLVREAERERLSRLFTQLQEKKISNEVMETFGFRLVIPSGFYVAKNTGDFMWIRKETKDFSQGLMIYTTPYTDTSLFNMDLLINRRNQMAMIHIPGPREGSYMTTEVEYAPVSRKLTFKDRFAVETRGLWKVEGDFMGGPFLNYAIHDEAGGRIINLDAYVFYPNEDKRDLMLQMETVIYSFDLQQPEK